MVPCYMYVLGEHNIISNIAVFAEIDVKTQGKI